jgi:hypothetical protein
MRDAKITILEDQLDDLAGRVADAEERIARLLRVLTAGEVPSRLGLEAKDIADRCAPINPGGYRWRHSDERRRLVAKADLDDFRRRVATAESVAEMSGRSFLEAFDASRDADDHRDKHDLQRTESTGQTIWHQVLAHLSTVVNRYSFTTWLADTTLARDDGKTVVVHTPDRLAAEWLTKRYTDVVALTLASLGRPNTQVTFVTAEDDDGQT